MGNSKTSILDLVLNLSVTGNGTEKLGGFASQLKSIAGQAGGGAGKALKGGVAAWDLIGDSMSGTLETLDGINSAAAHMVQLLDSAADAGRTLMTWGLRGLDTLMSAPMELLQATAHLETGFLRMKAMSKGNEEAARTAMRVSSQMVKYTPYQEHQIMGLATALKAGKVEMKAFTDAQGEAITLASAQAQGLTKLDKTIRNSAKNMEVSGISVMADLAASFGQTGQQMDAFVRGVERALSTGSAVLLRDQLPYEVMKEVFGGTGKIKKSGSEVIDSMYKYLLKRNQLGMSAAMSQSYVGIMSNLQEMPMLLSKAIVGDPSDPNSLYTQLKNQLGDAVDALGVVIADKGWQKGIQEGLGPVVKLVGQMTKYFAEGVAAVVKFVGMNPMIVKVGIALFAAASALAVLVGGMILLGATVAASVIGFLALAASVGVSVAAFLALDAAILPLLAPLGAILLKVTLITGGVLLLTAGVAILTAGLAYLWYEFGGGKETISDILDLFSAVGEAIRNWDNGMTSISDKSAQKLEKSGMLPWFMNIVKVLRRVEVFAKRAWFMISYGFDEAMKVVGPAFRDLGRLVEDLVDEVGHLMKALGFTSEATDKVGDAAGIMGDGFGATIGLMIEATGWLISKGVRLAMVFVRFFRLGVRAWTAIGYAVVQVSTPFRILYNIISNMYEIMKAMFNLDFGKLGDLASKIWGDSTANPFSKEGQGRTVENEAAYDDNLRRSFLEQQPGFEPGAHPMDRDPMFGGGGDEPTKSAPQKKASTTIVNKNEVTLEVDGEVLARTVIEKIKDYGELNYGLPGLED